MRGALHLSKKEAKEIFGNVRIDSLFGEKPKKSKKPVKKRRGTTRRKRKSSEWSRTSRNVERGVRKGFGFITKRGW